MHIPYRNSVLTWLLKESLGGNAITTMLACGKIREGGGEGTLIVTNSILMLLYHILQYLSFTLSSPFFHIHVCSPIHLSTSLLLLLLYTCMKYLPVLHTLRKQFQR
jgi:hypothetical protein